MCVYSAYMSRVIAEYELHEPEKVRMRVGEIGAGERGRGMRGQSLMRWCATGVRGASCW